MLPILPIFPIIIGVIIARIIGSSISYFGIMKKETDVEAQRIKDYKER